VLLFLAGQGAQAQPTAAPPTLRLASKTPWVAPGQELVLRVHVEADDREATELAVSVHSRLTSRSEFERSLETAPRGAPLTVVSAPLAQLGADPAGALTVRLPVQDPAQPRDPNRLFLAKPGVYPVRVELREGGGGGALAGFTTHLVAVGTPEVASRLGTLLVLPFHAPPTTKPGGERGELELAGLADLAASLSAHRARLSIQPTPETLESLAEAGPAGEELLSALDRGLEGKTVIGSTYAAVDAAALLAAGLGEELTAQRARGTEILVRELDQRPDPGLWAIEGTVDPRVLSDARSAQVTRLIVRDETLEPVSLPLTLAQPFVLQARRSSPGTPTLSADTGLAAHFLSGGEGADPVLQAHHLLADLATIYFDSPGAERVVVAMPPLAWKPDRPFLDALLGALAQSPVIEPLSPDQAFGVPLARGSRRGTDLVRMPLASTPEPIPAGAIRNAREDIEDFAGLVDTANPVIEILDRTLLTAQAGGLTSATRRALVSSIDKVIEEQFAKVSLPGNRSITLTARTGEIPVTIQSGLDYPIRARLLVESDRLTFPGGSQRDLELENDNTTERFTVQARGSGAFPLRVVLESPEGDLVLGRSLFTVRSTAASGVGIALSGGAGGFLAIWWARHLVASRREKRRATAA
jgi:hypothetical protein